MPGKVLLARYARGKNENESMLSMFTASTATCLKCSVRNAKQSRCEPCRTQAQAAHSSPQARLAIARSTRTASSSDANTDALEGCARRFAASAFRHEINSCGAPIVAGSRIERRRRHDHEVRRGEVGTARCARAGQTTTRSKWQRQSDASSSSAIHRARALLPIGPAWAAATGFLAGKGVSVCQSSSA